MPDIVHGMVFVFIIIIFFLLLVMIFLNYKWTLDIMQKIDDSFGKVNQHYQNDKSTKLNSITDEVQRFTRNWEDTSNRNRYSDDNDYNDAHDDRVSSALDDLLDRYSK